jgi:hypothetical protein
MIDGYSPDEEDGILSSIQFLTIEGSKNETYCPFQTRLAAAVTLSTGAIVVTGGCGSENKVWMNPSLPSRIWHRKQEMPEGRKGHASTSIRLRGEEVVIVAGGWGVMGTELSSVFVYKPEHDMWSRLPNMPNPRVDFALQVDRGVANMKP